MPRTVRKSDLPTKICAACGRPFSWRKKWARDWQNVRYCSKACRSGGRGKDAARETIDPAAWKL